MKMDRVIVAAFVFHRDSITLTFLYNQRVDIRPGFTVDSPAIKPAVTTENFLEYEIEAMIGFRSRRVSAEHRVIPGIRRRFRPLGWPGPAGVFNDDAEAHFAHVVIGVAENPHSRIFHFDDGINPFRRSEDQYRQHT